MTNTLKKKNQGTTPTFIVLFTEAKGGSSTSVHLWMNGLRKCGTCIQWNIIQP